MKKPIAQFYIQQHSFSLYFERHEFTLQLDAKIADHLTSDYMSGQAWLNFEDASSMEDVNLKIDAFAVSIQARQHMLRYIQKHQLDYFYFHAATARKAKIYPRIARLLVAQLPDYAVMQADQDFYFYMQS